MATTLLSRVRSLNKAFTPARLPAARGPVVLVLDRDQRLADNWAVTYAQDAAKTLAVPLVVAFASEPSVGTTLRAWSFALRGVAEVQRACDAVGIPFVLLHGTAAQTAGRFAIEQGASLLVTDFSPLRADRAWRASVAAELERAAPAIGACEVDAHNVVPVWLASDKLEYAARTLRPRLMRQLPAFLVEYPPVAKQSPDAWRPAAGKPVSGGAAAGAESPLRWTSGASIDWEAALATASLDRSVAPVSWATPGHEAGTAALRAFLAVSRLTAYAESRNNPTLSATSGLSPWLHCGHISPARAALEAYKVRNATAPKAPSAKVIAGVDSFVEELVVRRELSDNFCHYNVRCAVCWHLYSTAPPAMPLQRRRYDDLDGLYPQFGNDSWAQRTLRDHVGDKREYVYSESELERGKTHDALWNAAQLEMVRLGKMHGFMRMYWAKKILEWSASPADALRVAIALNDK